MNNPGTFLVVQWLRLQDSTAVGMGPIPCWGTKILHATQYSKQNKTNIYIYTHTHINHPTQLVQISAVYYEKFRN